MKVNKIILSCGFDESDKFDCKMEIKVKEPDIAYCIDFTKHDNNRSGDTAKDIKNLIEMIKSSISSAEPFFVNHVINYASKEFAEYMKEHSPPEKYQDYIKCFPENA